MKMLLIFIFETGDGSCPHYEVSVIAEDIDMDSIRNIEDSFSSYLESTASDDKEYEDMVEDVMKEAGHKFKWAGNSIPTCANYHIIYI